MGGKKSFQGEITKVVFTETKEYSREGEENKKQFISEQGKNKEK